MPLNQTCYLLHQSIEKWVKAALHLGKGEFRRIHDLGILLDNASKDNPNLLRIKGILEEDNVLLDQHYPDRVRYREEDYDLLNHLCILTSAAFFDTPIGQAMAK